MSWIQTYTGKRFELRSPLPILVDIRDIAHSLSNICRFGGHTNRFYSVSQHSVHVSRLVDPEFALQGLMHDAHEGVLGFDPPRPVKHLLGSSLPVLQAGLDSVIFRRFGIEPTERSTAAVKRADDIALATEVRDLMGGAIDGWEYRLPEPDSEKIIPWSSHEASALRFKNRFLELTVDAKVARQLVAELDDMLLQTGHATL